MQGRQAHYYYLRSFFYYQDLLLTTSHTARPMAACKLRHLGLERVVAQHLDLGFHRVDIGDQCLEGLELAPFTTSEDLTKKTHN